MKKTRRFSVALFALGLALPLAAAVEKFGAPL